MKKALIVVDMQNDFITGSLGTKEAQAIVPNVVNKINKAGWENIIVTQDTHQTDYLNTTEGKYLPVEHCIKGTKGWELHSEVEEALSAKLDLTDTEVIQIEKPNFGTFEWFTSDLIEIFTKENVEVHLVGICTAICVASNATILKTAFPDIKVVVDASCCACVTPESHKAALQVMKLCQINIIGE